MAVTAKSADCNAALDFEKNMKLVHKITNKVMSRVGAMKTCYSKDDIFQELSLVWVECAKSFDCENGAKFSTYFVRSAYNQINRLLKKEETSPTNSKELAKSDDGDDIDIFDVSDLGQITNYELRLSVFAHEIESLSEEAKCVVKWTISPPNELLLYVDALSKQKKQNAVKKTRGISNDIAQTLSFAKIIFGMTKTQMYSVRAEVMGLIERLGDE